MTMAVLNYRQNPTDPALFKKNSKKLKKDKKDLDHKLAYLSNEINLEDYLYSQAANIDFIEYLDVDEVPSDSSEESICAQAALSEFNEDSQPYYPAYDDYEFHDPP